MSQHKNTHLKQDHNYKEDHSKKAKHSDHKDSHKSLHKSGGCG